MHGPHPRALNIYIVLYGEMVKKSSSQEVLQQIGQYLAWNFPRTVRFNFVTNGPAPGLKHSNT